MGVNPSRPGRSHVLPSFLLFLFVLRESRFLASALTSIQLQWNFGSLRKNALRTFSSPTTFAPATTSVKTARLEMAIDAISVESLGDDHERIGTQIKDSVQRWLDAEWMPQEVHERMAESCKRSYCRCRDAGQTDLMTIMIAVAEDLDRDWREYDADAFVNAWDIGNYVSDFLTSQSGIEGCECSNRIY